MAKKQFSGPSAHPKSHRQIRSEAYDQFAKGRKAEAADKGISSPRSPEYKHSRGAGRIKTEQIKDISTGYVAKPGSMVNPYKETRLPLGPDAWNSPFLYSRRAFINISGLAQGSGTWQTARVEDFTGVNADGSGGDRDRLYRAMLQVADHTLIKDWDNQQMANFLEMIAPAIDLLVAMNIQAYERNANKLLTEDDTSGIWTSETYVSFLAGIDARGLAIPQFAVEIAKNLCVHLVVTPSMPVRNIPAKVIVPFYAQLSLTQARLLVDAIKARQTGALHAAKAKLPMVKLTSSLCSGLNHPITQGGDEWLFWVQHMIFEAYKAGGAVVLYDMTGSTTPWDRITNDTTSYTGRTMYWLGDRPTDLWGLLDGLLFQYNASYNKGGGLVFLDPASGYMTFRSVAQNGTTYNVLDFPAYVSLVVEFCGPMQTLLQFSNDSVTDAINFGSITLSGKEAYYKTNIPKVEWDDWEDVAHVAAFRGGLPIYGISSGKVTKDESESSS